MLGALAALAMVLAEAPSLGLGAPVIWDLGGTVVVDRVQINVGTVQAATSVRSVVNLAIKPLVCASKLSPRTAAGLDLELGEVPTIATVGADFSLLDLSKVILVPTLFLGGVWRA